MTPRSILAMAMVTGLAALPPALGQERRITHYEPSQRLRTGLDTCMKDEVMNGANCVKKCQDKYRLDLTSRPPLCIATQPDAKYVPQRPAYETPEKALTKGAPGA
jgi:hypothetical protein